MTRTILRILAIAFGAWGSVPYYANALAAQGRDEKAFRRSVFIALAYTTLAAIGIVG